MEKPLSGRLPDKTARHCFSATFNFPGFPGRRRHGRPAFLLHHRYIDDPQPTSRSMTALTPQMDASFRPTIWRRWLNLPFRSLLREWRFSGVRWNLPRILNLIQILLSLSISRIIRRPVVWGIPPLLMIEPTNLCNLKCPMCPSGNGTMTRPRGKLDIRWYLKLLDEIGDRLIQIQLWNQGEPFIHHQLLHLIRHAKRKGIMVITSTNGHFLHRDEQVKALVRSGLSKLIFSLDGTHPDTYARYRVGGNFHRVLEGLRRLVRIRRELRSATPIIELQFLVLRYNQQEIARLIRLGRQLGINRIVLKSVQIYSREQAETFLPDDPRFNRYRWKSPEVFLKGRLPDWCKRLWLNPAINWDGSFSPCCFDKDAQWAVGNLFREGQPFVKLWKSPAFQQFRVLVLSRRREISICRNCTEGLPQPYTYVVELS